ncbi:MAG: substrate-binding domain-containing protein [Bacteroidota bacterium]|nr:substrate-binding domain-containing protein [Bacteroidota bacterium]
MKIVLIYFSYTICSLILYGCKFDEIKSVSTTGEISIAVDENVEPLMKDEIKEFERLNPEAKIKMKSEPTNNVIADLINGQTNLIVSTRNFSEEEKSLLQKNREEVKEYPIAVDGIGFIVNVKNPVTRVTSEDLKKIFSGEYKIWTNIISQDAVHDEAVKKFFNTRANNIKVFIQRKNSSTYQYVMDSILNKVEYSITASVCSTSVQMLNSVRNNENAIGIINMNWLSTGHQDTIDSTIKVLRISKIWGNGRQDDFAEFHQGFLYNGNYPYRRTIFVFTTQVDMNLATGFITFLIKTDGQKIVVKNSLAPVRQPERSIQIN